MAGVHGATARPTRGSRPGSSNRCRACRDTGSC
jgi:hypothetical protein